MTRWTLLGAAIAAAASAAVDPAAAASAVTFVSGRGVDSGTCTRAAPCRTFQFALGLTSAGGIVSALDPAAYGAVMITQSVTIAGPGKGGAAITPRSGSSPTGIAIAAPGATVVLRGLEIDGGVNGIDVSAVGSLDIGAVVINGASNLGLNLNATGAKTTLHDSSIVSGASDAIDVNAGSLVAMRVSLAKNAGNGFFIQGASSALDIIDSTVTGSTVGVDTRDGTTFIKGTLISGSSIRGVNNDGGTVYLDTASVLGSGGTDVNQGTGTAIYSYGNNNFFTTNGAITPIAGD